MDHDERKQGDYSVPGPLPTFTLTVFGYPRSVSGVMP